MHLLTSSTRPGQRSVVVALGAVALLASVAGCSSGPDFDTFPAATTAVTVVAPPTSPAPTSPVEVSTAASAETTVVPAATTPPTDPPAPTTTLEQSAIDGFLQIEAVLDACAQNPTTCPVDQTAVPGSREFDEVASYIDGRVRDGLVSHEVPELNYQNIEAVRIGVDSKSAVITFCEVDGFWLHDANGTWEDQSDDVLIDDSLNSWRIEKSLVLTADGWRGTELTRLEDWRGENQCGPRA